LKGKGSQPTAYLTEESTEKKIYALENLPSPLFAKEG
jgi:hypothetical protein